jgi:DNA-directed RNA polymerase subunit N (RpoN/RPB10)
MEELRKKHWNYPKKRWKKYEEHMARYGKNIGEMWKNIGLTRHCYLNHGITNNIQMD